MPYHIFAIFLATWIEPKRGLSEQECWSFPTSLPRVDRGRLSSSSSSRRVAPLKEISSRCGEGEAAEGKGPPSAPRQRFSKVILDKANKADKADTHLSTRVLQFQIGIYCLTRYCLCVATATHRLQNSIERLHAWVNKKFLVCGSHASLDPTLILSSHTVARFPSATPSIQIKHLNNCNQLDPTRFSTFSRHSQILQLSHQCYNALTCPP